MNTYIGPGEKPSIEESPIGAIDARKGRLTRIAIVGGAVLTAAALTYYGVAGSNHNSTPVQVSSQPAGEGSATFSGNTVSLNNMPHHTATNP